MALYSEATEIYDLADQWRRTCLVDGRSLLWRDEAIWSEHNLQQFKTHFTDKPDEGPRGFEEKFQEQLAASTPDVTKLACELVLVYFLFPASSSVSGNRKRKLLSTIASWRDIQIGTDAEPLLKRLDVGIGGTGQYYNTSRPLELSYLGNVALCIATMQADERKAIVNDHVRFRALLIEEEDEATRASKDTVLHLLFPDKYEWIASRSHKRRIVDTFREFLGDDGSEDTDDALLVIRQRLSELKVADKLDFYSSPLRECWHVTGDGEELSPLDGLGIKRQIVLYGPPGTGKTFEARQLADRIIRQGLLRSWKPRRYFESAEGDRRVRGGADAARAVSSGIFV